MRSGACNVNGMRKDGKRGELIKGFKDGRVDVLGLGKVHLLGKGEWEGYE